MRKRAAVVLALSVALTACGTKVHSGVQHATSNITPAQKAQAKQVANACLKKGGGFKAEYKCAVPPGHGAAFARCVINHAPKNKTQAAVETDLVNCGERFR